MHTKTTFLSSFIIKIVKIVPLHVFEVTVAFSKKPPDDDPRIETRVGVQF
jgi:hypothetical protein